ncbi:MAG: tetratricopeptide repeat protein [Panacagrimonas sp.]
MSFRSALALSLGLSLAGTITPALADEAEPAAPVVDAVPAESASPLTPQQQMQVQFQIMAGEMAAGRGQPELAAEAFVLALELQPDADLAGRTTQLALTAGNAVLAQRAARRWLELDPASMDAREVLARLALRDKDMDEAYTQALGIVQGHAGGPAEGFRHVALLLSAEGQRGEQVLEVLTRLVGAYPELAGARYALALAALRFEQLPLAEKSAREALKFEPDSRDYTLLLIGVLVRTEQLTEADALVAKLLKKAKREQKGEVSMTYARLLLDGGAREHARTQLKAALKHDEKDGDARYALGVMALTDREFDEAEALFKPLEADAERSGDVHYQLGRIAEARQQFPAAMEHYGKVKSGGQAIEAAVRQAAVMARMGQADEGRELLGQLRRQFPPLGPRLVLAEAEMLMEADRNDDALSVYTAALEQNPEDENLLYGRSLVFERTGRFADAETDLRSILSRDIDNARAMNALGYMLVVNTTRYEEAHDLIEGALKQAPDDAAVIDSMGWVLFKLGRLSEARDFLQKAADKVPEPEISAHLGEVLWAMGHHEQARQVWDKALAREPEHRALLETIKRLTR